VRVCCCSKWVLLPSGGANVFFLCWFDCSRNDRRLVPAWTIGLLHSPFAMPDMLACHFLPAHCCACFLRLSTQPYIYLLLPLPFLTCTFTIYRFHLLCTYVFLPSDVCRTHTTYRKETTCAESDMSPLCLPIHGLTCCSLGVSCLFIPPEEGLWRHYAPAVLRLILLRVRVLVHVNICVAPATALCAFFSYLFPLLAFFFSSLWRTQPYAGK